MRAKLPVIALVSALFAALFVLPGISPAVEAQSLGDVARTEEARRKALKQSAKVLTNKDLGRVPPISPPPATLVQPADEASTPGGDQAAEGKEQPAEGGAEKKAEGTASGAAPEASAKDQAYWAARAKDLRTQIARNETFAAALQSQINGLANEYTNQSDPLQQARLAAERQDKIAELDRVNRQIEDDKKALAALEEEARRAGVPASWLR
jgi:hypothetical protein